jgi:hypothetical protein
VKGDDRFDELVVEVNDPLAAVEQIKARLEVDDSR